MKSISTLAISLLGLFVLSGCGTLDSMTGGSNDTTPAVIESSGGTFTQTVGEKVCGPSDFQQVQYYAAATDDTRNGINVNGNCVTVPGGLRIYITGQRADGSWVAWEIMTTQ